MIDRAGSDATDTTEDIKEQDELLKSLRQVNEDGTLSRVICSDTPVTRASETNSCFIGSPFIEGMNLSEEVCPFTI